MLGNLQQESSLNPQSGAGTAHQGIAQWNDDRRKAIEDHFHKSLMDMSFDEQLEAINWEVTAGKYKNVGTELKSGSHEAGRAAAIIDRDYEAPANPGSLELPEGRRQARGETPGWPYAVMIQAHREWRLTRRWQPPQRPQTQLSQRRPARPAWPSFESRCNHINAPAGSSLHVTSDSPGLHRY